MAFKQVAAFSRPATFVTMGKTLEALDVTSAGPPRAVHRFSVSTSISQEIAVEPDGKVAWVCHRNQLARFEPGKPISTMLDPFTFAGIPDDACETHWVLRASRFEPVLFASLFAHQSSGPPLRRYVAKLDPVRRTAEALEHPWPTCDIAIDDESSTLFHATRHRRDDTKVLCHRFSGGHDAIEVRGRFERAAISMDRTRLALSGADIPGHKPAIAVLDLRSRAVVRELPSGTNAVWTARGDIYFVRGEHGLWRLDPATGTTEEVMTRPGTEVREHMRVRHGVEGSYATPPTPSPDGSWLAWNWCVIGERGREARTTLFDLDRREYRELGTYHHNFEWLG